jgi:thiol:disulfide interchange protein
MPPTDALRPGGPTRRDPVLLWGVALVLLFARITLGLVEQRNPPARVDRMSWVAPEAAVERARSSHRPILYDFTAEWCEPCRTLHDEVFADAKAARSLGQLAIPVQIVDREREDGRNSPLVDSLERVHQVTSFPTLVLVNADGRTIDRLEGYPGGEAVLRWAATASMKQRLDRGGGTGLTFP